MLLILRDLATDCDHGQEKKHFRKNVKIPKFSDRRSENFGILTFFRKCAKSDATFQSNKDSLQKT